MSAAVFGSRLGICYGAPEVHSATSITAQGHLLAATEIAVLEPSQLFTSPFGSSDGYLVMVCLETQGEVQSWRNGQLLGNRVPKPGDVCIVDLQAPQTFSIAKGRTLHYYVPRDALIAASDLLGINHRTGLGLNDWMVADHNLYHLALAIRPHLRHSSASKWIIDHLLGATLGHVLLQYGGHDVRSIPIKGNLTAWRHRVVMDMLNERLTQGVSVEELACACKLSVSAFARAFKVSTGFSPHEWLIQQRIERATAIMRSTELSLAEIAHSVGFSDQSHFTRMFGKCMGTSPAAWRAGRASIRSAPARPADAERAAGDRVRA